MSVDDEFYEILRIKLGKNLLKSYVDFERQDHVLRMDYSNPDYGEGANEANKTTEHAEYIKLQIELDRVTKPVPHPVTIRGGKGVSYRDHPNSVKSTLKRLFAEYRERAIKEFEID